MPLFSPPAKLPRLRASKTSHPACLGLVPAPWRGRMWTTGTKMASLGDCRTSARTWDEWCAAGAGGDRSLFDWPSGGISIPACGAFASHAFCTGCHVRWFHIHQGSRSVHLFIGSREVRESRSASLIASFIWYENSAALSDQLMSFTTICKVFLLSCLTINNVFKNKLWKEFLLLQPPYFFPLPPYTLVVVQSAKHDRNMFFVCLLCSMTMQLRKKLKLKLLHSLIHGIYSPSMCCSSSFPSLISMRSMCVPKKRKKKNLQGLFQLMRFLLDVRLVRFNEGVCPEHIVLYMVHLVGLQFWHWVQRRWLWKVTLINDGNGDVCTCACALSVENQLFIH